MNNQAQSVTITTTPCPTCGHCPTCGKSASPWQNPWTVPYAVPTWQVDWWSLPRYQVIPNMMSTGMFTYTVTNEAGK